MMFHKFEVKNGKGKEGEKKDAGVINYGQCITNKNLTSHII
jgi:hypothetical protein